MRDLEMISGRDKWFGSCTPRGIIGIMSVERQLDSGNARID